MKKRALQRRVSKLPHTPSSLRLGARQRDDLLTRAARGVALLDWAPTFHPISWTPVRLLADGTTEDLPPEEATAATAALHKAPAEVSGHGPV